MIINSLRVYFDRRTTAEVYVNGELFGESLEDPGRPQGVKIPGETCIPEATYQVAITHSNKFGKPMMVLFNRPMDHSIMQDDIRFTGIRVHDGVSTKQTEGCILLRNYGHLQAKVQAALDNNEQVFWVISRR